MYKIPCECGKVYIGETERSMRERNKEYDRDYNGFLEPNPPPFQNTAMRRGTIRSGMRLSLLTETHIGTPVHRVIEIRMKLTIAFCTAGRRKEHIENVSVHLIL